MKKLLLSSAAMMLAFSFSALASTTENKEEAKSQTTTTASSTTMYEWFDANTNASLGQHSLADQERDCGPAGDTPCAIGYELDEFGNPVENAPPVEVKIKP